MSSTITTTVTTASGDRISVEFQSVRTMAQVPIRLTVILGGGENQAVSIPLDDVSASTIASALEAATR